MKNFTILFCLLVSFSTSASENTPFRQVHIASGVYQANPNLHSTLFVGMRKNVSENEFRSRVASHVSLVSSLMKDHYLISYTIYMTENYEAAVMQWKSEIEMNQAFAEVGAKIQDDAAQFLEAKIWKKISKIPLLLSEDFFENNIGQVSDQ